MYLGKCYQDVVDNIKPLYPEMIEECVIVAIRKGLWLLTLKQAAYIKHHVARVHSVEILTGLTEEKRSKIYFGIKRLYAKGVL